MSLINAWTPWMIINSICSYRESTAGKKKKGGGGFVVNVLFYFLLCFFITQPDYQSTRVESLSSNIMFI